MVSPAPSKSSVNRGGVIILVVSLVLALVVAGVIIGEVYMRNKIKDCIGSSFKDLGAEMEVGLSPTPVLLQVMGGEINYVTLKNEKESTGSVKGLTIDARIDGIDTGTGATKSSEAVITWSTQGILTTLQQQDFGSFIESVTSNPDGTLVFTMALGLASATIKVTVLNGAIHLETVSTDFLGFGVPNDIVDNILTTMNDSLSSSDLPFGLKAKSVVVTSTGLTLQMEGAAWTPPPPTAGQQATPGQESQSVTSC